MNMPLNLRHALLVHLVRECQTVMVDWLRPDGIDAFEAMSRMTALLDSEMQRVAQGPLEQVEPWTPRPTPSEAA